MEKKWLIILLIIICVGSFLRIYKLSNQSFWIDEAAAIQKSSKLPSLDNFKSWVIPWMSPPFYNLLLHFWIILFGESEFAVRSLSVIFGILTILVVYFVGAGAGLMVIGNVAGMAKMSMGEMAFIDVATMAVGNAGGRIFRRR